MNKKQKPYPLTEVFAVTLFIFIVLLAIFPSANFAVKIALIDPNRQIGQIGDVVITVGDALTLFTLFAASATIGLFFGEYRRRRSSK